jgi:hypothetical protein
MNVDRNVLQIIYWFIHESITQDLIVEYHSRVKLICNCTQNVCNHCIWFNNRWFNHRKLSCPGIKTSIFIFKSNGKRILYNKLFLRLPNNY